MTTLRSIRHSLAGLVVRMGREVMDGDVFAFASRNRKRG